jgi:hypothetical protein
MHCNVLILVSVNQGSKLRSSEFVTQYLQGQLFTMSARACPQSQAAKRLRDDAQFHDIVFKCVDGEISANRAYLAACSDYFKAMFFSNAMTEASTGVVDLSGAGVPARGALC